MTGANDDNDGRRKPGRKSIHSDVREKLVRSGLELMVQRGFRASLNKVSFVEVVEHSGVARATAYRALAAGGGESPAEWLDRELLKAALRDAPGGSEFDSTAAAGLAVYEANSDRMAEGTVRDLTDIVRAMMRVATDANFDAVVNSVYWQAYMIAASALATQGADADPEMLEILHESELRTTEDFARFYETIASAFGRKIRPEYTWGQLATMLAALVEGLAMRARYSEHLHSVARRTGPGGSEEPWSPLGVGTEALMIAMTEPIPGRVAADLTIPDHDGSTDPDPKPQR